MNAFIDVTNLIIKTNRLLLRAFKKEDLDDLFEYASVDGVGEMAGWNHHQSKEETLKILNMFIEEKKTLAITLNNKVIGSIGIEEYGEKKLTEFDNFLGRELGFVLSKDYWGNGIMKEAVDAIIDYLFNELNLDFLTCGHFDKNNQSKRVQEKCGFKPYRKIVFDTRMNTKEPGTLNILFNPSKEVKI